MATKFNAPVAKMQHEMWKNKLITFLNGGTAPTAVSHRECDLGKWLYGGGLEDNRSVPDMRKLEQQHQEFHDRIRRVIELQQAGNRDQAWEIYESLKPMSVTLEGVIDTVSRQMK